MEESRNKQFLRNGTRQGSVLSPYLFSIYMRRLSVNVVDSGLGCRIGGMSVYILVYADDLVILAPSWLAQQKLLNICNECVLSLDVKFNTLKSVTMIFAPYKTARRVSYTFPSLMLNGCSLDVVTSYRYLGHVISSVYDDNTDILRQMSLFYA
jgi:Reverse transcriptase (RNA-dependent DNA polymerase)